MGINVDTNTDEVEPEVDTILPRLSSATDALEVRRLVHEEFVRWVAPANAGPKEGYDGAAPEIGQTVQRFRATAERR